MRVQAEALAAADRQVTAWGIEHNERGERADAYLYCVEVKPEGCDYFIPLAPSWLIGEKSKVATGGYFLPKVTVKLFGEKGADAFVLGGYLREAYQEAEAFSLLLQQRVQGAGFFKTLLLRRLGSFMEAGRRTVNKLLGGWIAHCPSGRHRIAECVSAVAQRLAFGGRVEIVTLGGVDGDLNPPDSGERRLRSGFWCN